MHTPADQLNFVKELFHHSAYPVIFTAATGEVLYSNNCLSNVTSVIADGEEQRLPEAIKTFTGAIQKDAAAKLACSINDKHYLFTATAFNAGFLITGTDVTSLAAERDFYKETLDNLPADIGVFDMNGHYLYVNPIGIKDAALREWIIGKTDFDYCRYRGRDTSMAEFRSQVSKKVTETKSEQGYEEEIKRPGQDTDWQLRKLSPVFDKSGNIKFILGYGINIKDRKKAELAQKEALDMIGRSAKAKEEFVAVMSHEIRTPMNAIIGMSRLLAKTLLDQKQSEYLDAILIASGNLIVIVNDILDFSKIEAGKLRLEHSGFSFTEVIEYARAVTTHQATEKGLKLEFNVDTNVADIFIGDVYRINQVVVNLLNNAIKFTHKGTVSTSVELEKDSKDQQAVRICVKDSGIGMTEDFMQDMFTMYSQEEGVTRKYGGTGLGLKITSQLVELMKGHIEVKSKKNEGSCISVKLSLQKGNEADIPHAAHLRFSENALQGKRILIAEDNNLNVLVVSNVLQNYGAIVVTAANGQQAVDILSSQNNIHAVLMDVEMPVMDGIEATHIIRKNISATLPVIALTANVMPEDKERLLAAGMDDFIAKPFAEADLIGALLRSIK
jgi:signal transduction histidine kinase/CheY-like chemotaxis protein